MVQNTDTASTWLGKTPESVEFRDYTKRERCGIGSDTVSTALAASSQSQTHRPSRMPRHRGTSKGQQLASTVPRSEAHWSEGWI